MIDMKLPLWENILKINWVFTMSYSKKFTMEISLFDFPDPGIGEQQYMG